MNRFRSSPDVTAGIRTVGLQPGRSVARGFTLLEIIVSMILLGIVLAMVVPMTRLVVEQRRRSETRRAALLEVSNALERLTIDPSRGPAVGEEQTLPVSESLAARLKEPTLVVRTEAVDGPPAGRRFDASLTWSERSGRRAAPLRLSAFVFEAGDSDGDEP